MAKACFKWLFQNQAHALKICYAKFNIVHFFIIWQKWTEGKMKKKIYFLSVLSTVNTVFLMQYICKEKKKQSQLLFSILNNYNIYKLFRITNTQTHTHTHRHTQVHIFFLISGFILSAGRGNESFQSPWSEKGNPFSFLTPTFLEPWPVFFLPFPHAELIARLV